MQGLFSLRPILSASVHRSDRRCCTKGNSSSRWARAIRLQNGAPLLEDITPFPFVTYSKTSYIRRRIERLSQPESIAPAITMELENEKAIEKMIEINMGVAMLSKRRAVSDRIHYLAVKDC